MPLAVSNLVSGAALAIEPGRANDRNRRNLAVDGVVGEGPLATLLRPLAMTAYDA
jgi:hypothetical protein